MTLKMSRLTANPCRYCLQNPVITIDNDTCSVRCTHCSIEIEDAVKSEAVRLWNDEYGVGEGHE